MIDINIVITTYDKTLKIGTEILYLKRDLTQILKMD